MALVIALVSFLRMLEDAMRTPGNEQLRAELLELDKRYRATYDDRKSEQV